MPQQPHDITLRVARLSDRNRRQRFAVVAEFGSHHCAVAGRAVWVNPVYAEAELTNGPMLQGCLAIIRRGGGVSFFEKARRAQECGAVAAVVINQDDRPFIAHHEPTDRVDLVQIPVICMPLGAAQELLTEQACADGICLNCDPAETLTVRLRCCPRPSHGVKLLILPQVKQFTMAREAEKESVLYEQAAAQEYQQQEQQGMIPQAKCAGWVEKDGAAADSAAGTTMHFGAQSWDFGVNITNMPPPQTPGGRISNWLQSAQAGLSTPSAGGLPGSPWSSRHPPGYGQRWEYQPCVSCTPHSQTRDLANSARLQLGSPAWRKMSAADREEATRLMYEAQRAQLRGEQPQGVINRNTDLIASCDAVMSPHRHGVRHAGDVPAAGTPARREEIDRLGAMMADTTPDRRCGGGADVENDDMMQMTRGDAILTSEGEDWESPGRILGALTPTAIF